MPRLPTIHTNFTAGELSARLRGRVDIARYQNGADIIENAIPLVQGGLIRRYGLRFVKPAKNADKRAILVPFVFNNDQAYVLEFGDLYMRIFKDQAQVESSPGTPYEMATIFTEAELPYLEFAQKGDTLLVASGTHPIQRIRRFSDTQWTLDTAPLDPVPFDEIGFRPAVNLTLSAATIGTGRTFTASAAVFLASDVGRAIWADTGIATITAYTSTTVVTCEITTAFIDASIASGEWQMRDSPRTTCTPSAEAPIGKAITLTLGAAGWRSSDVGKYVPLNLGLCKITGYTSTTVVDAVIVKEMFDTTAAPSEAWSVESAVWNAYDGYPKAIALHQQALYAAGTTTNPVTVTRSKIGDIYDFTMGTDDSDAFSYNIDSAGQNQILHLFPMNSLMALTGGNGFSLFGGVEKPITPTNLQADNETDHGSSQVRPVRVGSQLVFVQRAGKKLHAMAYDYSSDSFNDIDLSLLSSHITEPGITDMAYQQEPESLVWLTLNDGTFATCTIDKAQEIIGWARHSTDGVIESIATIPGDGTNETWCIVRRTIGGNAVRYVERFDPNLCTDCALTGTSGPGSIVWSGLNHLEGKIVDIIADGAVMAQQVVSGGEITLDRTAFAVEIGLHYAPRVKTLPLELSGGGGGTIQGTNQSINKAILRVLNTYGATINGQYFDFRKFGDALLDRPPPAFTGDFAIEMLGWDYGSQVDIVFDLPLKFHLLAVIAQLTTNN
jgi:hypothetical protein